MIDKIVTLALFPFHLTMSIYGLVTIETLEMLEEIGVR